MLTSLSTSAIIGQQVYGPYGNTRYQVGSLGTTKGYTGQFHDAVSGLDYYHARYYDPVSGQFLSMDNVQGNGQGANPYSYVVGNPETLIDPTGLRECIPDDNGHQKCGGDVGAGSSGPVIGGFNDAGNAINPPIKIVQHLLPVLTPSKYHAPEQAHTLANKVREERQSDRRLGNMAALGWYFTDAEGDMLDGLHFYKTLLSSGSGPYGHSENQLLVQWAKYGEEAQALQMLVNAWLEGIYDGVELHIVIFSQLPPCDACREALSQTLGTIAMQLSIDEAETGGEAPTEPGQIAVTLDVFASTYVPANGTNPDGTENRKDPQGRQNALYPGTLNYGITDYWNGYVYSLNGNWAAVY